MTAVCVYSRLTVYGNQSTMEGRGKEGASIITLSSLNFLTCCSFSFLWYRPCLLIVLLELRFGIDLISNDRMNVYTLTVSTIHKITIQSSPRIPQTVRRERQARTKIDEETIQPSKECFFGESLPQLFQTYSSIRLILYFFLLFHLVLDSLCSLGLRLLVSWLESGSIETCLSIYKLVFMHRLILKTRIRVAGKIDLWKCDTSPS